MFRAGSCLLGTERGRGWTPSLTVCIRLGFKLCLTREPACALRVVSSTCRAGTASRQWAEWAGRATPRLSNLAPRSGQHPTAGQSQPHPQPRCGLERFGTQIRGSRTQEEATRGKFISRATPRNLEPAASSARALIIQTSPCFFKTKRNKKSKLQPRTVRLQLRNMGLALRLILPCPPRPPGQVTQENIWRALGAH